MQLSAIVAVSRNDIIGRDGGMPWRQSADLVRFKKLTMGHHLITGRRTFASLGRALPGRTSIVLSRQQSLELPPGVLHAQTLDEALATCAGDAEPFVIGGGEIYALALPRVTRLYLTRIDAELAGDTRFPPLDFSAWRLVDEAARGRCQERPHVYVSNVGAVAGHSRDSMTSWFNIGVWWRLHKWRRGSRPTASELAVIRRLLPLNDPRSELLYQQALDAPGVEREFLTSNSYVLRIPFVKDDANLIEIDDSLTSPSATVEDLATGRKLTFTVKVLQGGFLNDLVGVAADGQRWPVDWSIDLAAVGVQTNVGQRNWLPAPMSVAKREGIIKQLAGWSNVSAKSISDELLSVNNPATKSQIKNAETQSRLKYPQSYVEFLKISNGLSIREDRPYDVFGTADSYSVEWDGKSYLVVTSLYEDGAIAIDTTVDSAAMMVRLDGYSLQHMVPGAFNKYVQSVLQRLPERT